MKISVFSFSDNYPSNSSPRICAPQDDKLGRKLYNLDSSVEVWSDFQRVHLHPRSIQLINDFTHGRYVFYLYWNNVFHCIWHVFLAFVLSITFATNCFLMLMKTFLCPWMLL